MSIGDLDPQLLEDHALRAERDVLPLDGALRLLQGEGALCHLDLLALDAAVHFQLAAQPAVPLRVTVLRLHELLGDAVRDLVRDAPRARVLDGTLEGAMRVARVVNPDVAFLVTLLLQLRQPELDPGFRVALEAEVFHPVPVGISNGLHQLRILDQDLEVINLLLRIGVATGQLAEAAVSLTDCIYASGEDSIHGYWCGELPLACALAGL